MYIDEACVGKYIVIFMQGKKLFIQMMNFIVGVIQVRITNHLLYDVLNDEQFTK